MIEMYNVSLKDVLTFKNGKKRPKGSGNIPVYGGNGILGYTDKSNYENCIVVGRVGAYCGSVYYEPNQCWVSDNAICGTPHKNVDIYYTMYLLKSLHLNQRHIGTSQPLLTQEILNSIECKVPSFNIQKKISGILLSIDNKIENNNAINRNLEDQAITLFYEKFIEHVPDGEQKTLYEFAEYINGTSFKKNEYTTYGVPIIKIAELKNGITSSTQYFSGVKDQKYNVKNGDILFSWSGNPDTSIDIFIWTHGNGILNQHTFNVKWKSRHKWFTYLLLKSFKPKFTAIASNKQTTGLGHITIADLKRLKFVYSGDAIDKFETEVTPLMEEIYSLMTENIQLNHMRDTLLPKLMSGELDVSKENF